MVSELLLDPGQSRVRLRTFAEGFFAKLAHDLELTCGNMSGTASRRKDGGASSVRVPISGIEVAGVVAQGKIDASALSRPERDMCLDKMRREVFHATPEEFVTVDAQLEGRTAHLQLTLPRGVRVRVDLEPHLVFSDDGSVVVSGTTQLSLRAIGSDVVRGPVNAFRVQDRVAVSFDVRFAPAL